MLNNNFNTLDVIKVCENKLGITFRHGKENNGWFEYEGRKITRVTIPCGRKPIPPKTYSSIAKQLRISSEELDELLKCPLSYVDYIELLAKKDLITSS